MRRIPVTLLVFMLFASVAYAYWSAKIDVYVIGRDGRGLGNATTAVVYQSTKCGDHVQIEKQTDQYGLAHFEFINTVDETFNTACVERSYTIVGSYSGYTNSTIGHLSDQDPKYFITLPMVQHILTVLDATNRTIDNASAMFGESTYYTNQVGQVFFSMPAGSLSTVYVTYGGITRTLKINPSTQSASTLQLPVYDLKVFLYDENGKRVNGTVTFGSESVRATTDAPALFERFAQESLRFVVTSGGKQKVLSATVTSDSLSIYFDFAPPSIRSVTAEASGKSVLVKASVYDEGKYASGLSGSPTISYTFVDDGYTEVKMFPVSANTFEGTIPAQGNNVKYRIVVSDQQANTNSHEGEHLFSGQKPAEEEDKPVAAVSPVHFVGILIFIIVVIFVYQKIREQFS